MQVRNAQKFQIYKHSIVYANNLIAEKQFIVLAHNDGTFSFTDFHRYAKNPNNSLKKFNEKNNHRLVYICKFLNYAFFSAGISSLSELTVEIGKNFLIAYGMHELPDDNEYTHRKKDTVARCVQVILDFYLNLLNDKSSGIRIKPEDLYRKITVRDKYGKAQHKTIPLFEIVYIDSVRTPIFRDMPNSAFRLLFDHIVLHHTDILGLIMLSAFGGLRPSEACNVRRPDSPLGAGIRFQYVSGTLHSISIDLQNEMDLRSDHMIVGGIKKERIVKVPDIFLNAFKSAYNIYMEYMMGRQYEPEYGAFSVNMQGKAITYDSYYSKFRLIIQDEMIPIYLASGDDELVLYGQTLMEHSLSPHVFRHWFTVQLVLSGINEPGVLMGYRGDTSPESALVYINSKGELEKQFSKISNETFDYISWAAAKKHNEGI